MDELERILDELASEAKSYPKGSKDRQKCLTKLTNAILQSRPSCQNYRNLPYPIYMELQQEAIQKVFLQLYDKKLDEYDPAKGHILHWFRETLRFRFQDICDEYVRGRLVQENNKKKRVRDKSLDKPVSQNDDPSSTTLLDLIEQPEADHRRYRELRQLQYEELRKLIEKDQTGQFREARVNEVTFQAIALGRLDGRSWEDLSQQWNEPISNISSLYQRTIEKLFVQSKAKQFNPIFRDYLDRDYLDT